MSFMDKKEVFFIAEVGGNHEGSFDYAKKLLEAAANSGAHAVKFQTYRGNKIVSPVQGKDRNKHFKKFELKNEEWLELAKLCKRKGIIFMSSVWDEDSLELLNPHIQIHKIGSGDMTNYPLIEKIVRKDKPVILSTAMATLEEIKDAVAFVRKINPELFSKNKFCLLHCVAMYGDPKHHYANLLSISTLKKEFPDIPIGYSDHTEGTYACELAMALGACVIEKHFTDDKKQAFRDHHISATKEEMQDLVKKSKKIKTLLGRYGKKPIDPIENKIRIKEFRRAVYPKEDLKAGTVLTKENLTTLRPNVGIDARKFYEILGKKLVRDKKAFEALYEGDLQ